MATNISVERFKGSALYQEEIDTNSFLGIRFEADGKTYSVNIGPNGILQVTTSHIQLAVMPRAANAVDILAGEHE